MRLESGTFNEDPYCLNPIHGQFCVCLKGDVTGNNQITAFDATQILKHVAGLPTPHDPISLCQGDVTCNGTITAFDAALILEFIAD